MKLKNYRDFSNSCSKLSNALFVNSSRNESILRDFSFNVAFKPTLLDDWIFQKPLKHFRKRALDKVSVVL